MGILLSRRGLITLSMEKSAIPAETITVRGETGAALELRVPYYLDLKQQWLSDLATRLSDFSTGRSDLATAAQDRGDTALTIT
jgi:hypothetical protein